MATLGTLEKENACDKGLYYSFWRSYCHSHWTIPWCISSLKSSQHSRRTFQEDAKYILGTRRRMADRRTYGTQRNCGIQSDFRTTIGQRFMADRRTYGTQRNCGTQSDLNWRNNNLDICELEGSIIGNSSGHRRQLEKKKKRLTHMCLAPSLFTFFSHHLCIFAKVLIWTSVVLTVYKRSIFSFLQEGSQVRMNGEEVVAFHRGDGTFRF